MHGAIPPLPNIPSWRGAQLRHRTTLFYLWKSGAFWNTVVVFWLACVCVERDPRVTMFSRWLVNSQKRKTRRGEKLAQSNSPLGFHLNSNLFLSFVHRSNCLMEALCSPHPIPSLKPSTPRLSQTESLIYGGKKRKTYSSSGQATIGWLSKARTG
jgi:hypothetical protein